MRGKGVLTSVQGSSWVWERRSPSRPRRKTYSHCSAASGQTSATVCCWRCWVSPLPGNPSSCTHSAKDGAMFSHTEDFTFQTVLSYIKKLSFIILRAHHNYKQMVETVSVNTRGLTDKWCISSKTYITLQAKTKVLKKQNISKNVYTAAHSYSSLFTHCERDLGKTKRCFIALCEGMFSLPLVLEFKTDSR